jgi:hypothetical protein
VPHARPRGKYLQRAALLAISAKVLVFLGRRTAATQALQEEHGAERPRPILSIFAGELRASAASNIVRLKRG